MAPALCGNVIRNRRSFLAMGWTIVNILAFLAFIFAISFAVDSASYGSDDDNLYGYNDNNNNNNNNGDNYQYNQEEASIAITSQAMTFAALWTAILAGILGVFGTMVLGVVSPSGSYYACCAQNVHRSTPVGIGAFIGALFMFANLTMVSAVIFGEFHIRDYYKDDRDRGGPDEEYQWLEEQNIENSSKAFSGLCGFLTILYAGFSLVVFMYSSNIIEENAADAKDELGYERDAHQDPTPGGAGNYVSPVSKSAMA